MCGIFGYSGPKTSWKHAMLLEALCIESEVRGKNSTGVVGLNLQTNSCLYSKKTLTGSQFVANGYTSFLYKNEFSNVTGHTRKASSGSKTPRNAHPFGVQVGAGWNFGTHNGTMKKSLADFCTAFEIEQPEVDSEAIFRAIAYLQNCKYSVPDAISLVMEWLSDKTTFACSYLSSRENAIYLFRNTERPLTLFNAQELDLGRWYCSTPEIFSAAWEKHRGALGDKSKVTKFSLKSGMIYKLTADGKLTKEKQMNLKAYQASKKQSQLPNQEWLEQHGILTGSDLENIQLMEQHDLIAQPGLDNKTSNLQLF